ncbi:hypothetical protein Pint_21716 [Pistacia integerrima]|uniref:Uncharacterized protein n=1 Tax=Pistacia integerrima TaxID=434235 RepID=A0ACC0XD55_9ROSI|nr:hypothetical protein Pint_21716 [Pistacia integerrima]
MAWLLKVRLNLCLSCEVWSDLRLSRVAWPHISSQILASDDVTTFPEPDDAMFMEPFDLKVFASFNEELFKEITQLLTLDNFRQNEQGFQIQLCKNPHPNPDIKTLFTDHSCNPTANRAYPPLTNNPLVGPIPKAGAFPPIGAQGLDVKPPPPPNSLVQSSRAVKDVFAFLKHPRTLTA